MLNSPTNNLDRQAAALLKQALDTLRRGFAEGLVTLPDLKHSHEVVKELVQTMEQEEVVETRMGMRHHMAGQAAAASSAAAGSGGANGGGKNVCCLVDGSSNSYAALRWALEHAVDPSDHVFLLTVTPYDDYTQVDAEGTLRDAYDFAHNAGVAVARLHPRSLSARGDGRTRGVGEAVSSFVEECGADLLVLGSRGLGSIKRSLMGTLGMGSVSDYCMQHVRCPVLVVKESPAAEAGTEGPALAQAEAEQ